MTRIVIAGGGVAGMEALIALRRHLGPEPEIEVIEPKSELIERQAAVGEPFGVATPRRFPMAEIAAEHGAKLRTDRISAIAPEQRRLRTVRGADLHYDALLVAVGARPDMAVGGALTFRDGRDVHAMTRLLDDLVERRVRSVGFAVPNGIAWTLPIYELAIMTAEHVHGHGVDDVRLVLVTPERDPLDMFGPSIASRIRALLSQHHIVTRSSAIPTRIVAGGLRLADERVVEMERVVALPRLDGPWLAGIPHDTQGFIPVDEHCAVLGVKGVWAAGDSTDFPIKQGSLAAQQADAAALSIAAALGAPVEAVPFHPVLHGALLAHGGSRYLKREQRAPSETPLWWPPTKVAAQYLAPYLDRHVTVGATTVEVEPAADADRPADTRA